MVSGIEAAVRAALAGLRDPTSGRDLVSAGMVGGVAVRDGMVQVEIAVPRERAREFEPVRAAAEAAARAVPGVISASAVLTAHRAGPSPAPQAAPQAAPHGHAHGAPQGAPRGGMLLGDVGAVIAVASGKGGVGKSTTAVNLAVALAQKGLRVGLLDADIYGPSLPQMLGAHEKPRVDGNRIIPIDRWGLKAMSIGFLVDQETPMIWRGPMVMGALEQMMSQVEWGALDVMVVDMPPGTGDTQLTMSQRVALRGAVIVSTPQDVALLDARRGIRMFEKVNVPVLGLIENMSYFCCPNCNHRSEVFGHGGARVEAERLGVEFLGELPLTLAIREHADAGHPVVLGAPDSGEARAYRAIAERVWAKAGGARAAGPRIVVD
ncbi:ATP-binding protein involved in chromosome partitioning [Roseomonas rosea]|uniref:Iron-sulfur cluster carrier protein n=1 Tax=Muricoccus roseus TaxID=198092 RepID=A0A1M6PNV9_9PROT|nr:Mrp/NBP35 family ATP-binding protein [Roseomonas rosea]SHK09619.1 ATP-binding protein involved in chromosome partitioning [Roseomonas rosea]